MPPTEESARVTEAYRQRLIRMRDGITRLVAPALGSFDLDGDVDAQVTRWLAAAVSAVEAGQADAARLGDRYITGYLRGAGIERQTTRVDVSDHVGRDSFGRTVARALESAPTALLWRLGSSHGRAAAMASGLSTATRATRTAITDAARSAQAAVMDSEPRISGWRRVTSSRPCGACLASSDGRVHPAGSLPETHDSCRCTVEPVLTGVPDRFRRPTGQEMFDRMGPQEQDALFAGTGGAAKAATVRERGVGVLLSRQSGRITETPLANV